MNQDRYFILLRFITCFTEDEAQARQILDDSYKRIMEEALDTTPGFVQELTHTLNRARQTALEALSEKAFEGKCWSDRKNFFPLSPAMTENHKEVFCLRFYRGLSEQVIADRLKLSSGQVDILLREALCDISQQSIIKINMIADL